MLFIRKYHSSLMEGNKLVDYTDYFSAISNYGKPTLNEQDKGLLFRIMNELDISSQLGSYLKFRDKDNSIEIQSIATRLINHGLIDERKSRLLRGLRKYKLSSLGIFYVLSETTSYSPVFLKKYSKDAILQSILYSYFEEDTISSVTGRLYSIITDYLRQSCKRTAAILEDIRSSNKADYKDEMVKNLELELEWSAKTLAFKITIMYTESNIHASNPKSDGGDASVTYYELEHRMKEILSNDKKFMSFLNKVREEFDEGFREIGEAGQ